MPAEPTHAITANTSSRRTRSSLSGIGSQRISEPVPHQDDRHRPYPETSTRKVSRSKGASHMRRSSKSGKGKELNEKEDEDEGQEDEDTNPSGASRGRPQADQGAPFGSYYPASAYPPYEVPGSPSDRVSPSYEENPGLPSTQASPPRSQQRTLPPPGSLNQLADGPDGNMARPPYPYSTLIRYAIEGSRNGRLTLAELYSAIENRFPWFLTCGNGWKNSIRHNLSLNKSFIKVARPITEPGKGSYWSINHLSTSDDLTITDGGVEPLQQEIAPPPPPYEGKKRGRKKRDPNLATEMLEPESHVAGQRHRQDDSIYSQYETSRMGDAEDEPSKDVGGMADSEGLEHKGSSVRYEHGNGSRDTRVASTSTQGGPRLGATTDLGWFEGTYRIPDTSPHLELATIQQQQPTSYHVPYSIPQHVHVPEFVDDRPDRSAPRTIYNHTANSLNPIAYVHGGVPPPPLGSMTNSPSYPHPLYYSRFAMPSSVPMLLGSTTTSSLAAAMTMPSPTSATNPSTAHPHDVQETGDTHFN
ncbi:hypothetical protein FRB95_006513 [Tulasnella sp. JGI-2019a]|nr:hypothetical protein FRB95_006513 [Tulasnella sp. JGI-2019a]